MKTLHRRSAFRTLLLAVSAVAEPLAADAQHAGARQQTGPWLPAASVAPAALNAAPRPEIPERAVLALDPERPPAVAPVLAGTILGGALGAAAGGAIGAVFGTTQPDDGSFISPVAALGMLGVAAGYPLGAAAGARLGATVDGARPGLGRMALISLAGALAGGLVWNRVGETFEGGGGRSWYAGAVAGFATHVAITTFGARSSPRSTTRAVPPPGEPGS